MAKPKVIEHVSREVLEHEAMTLSNRPPDLLKRIKELGQKQVDLEAKAEEQEQALTTTNKEIEIIRGGPGEEGQLPQAMQEAEMTEFRLENGAVIKVAKEYMMPSMAKDSIKREPMIKWLEENDNASAVKNSIIIFFEKGDPRVDIIESFLKVFGGDVLWPDFVKSFMQFVESCDDVNNRVAYDKFATIHAQTLKKLIKEILEAGEEFPMEELGVSVYNQSKVGKK